MKGGTGRTCAAVLHRRRVALPFLPRGARAGEAGPGPWIVEQATSPALVGQATRLSKAGGSPAETKAGEVACPTADQRTPGGVSGVRSREDEEADGEHEQDEKDDLNGVALRAGRAAGGGVVHGE